MNKQTRKKSPSILQPRLTEKNKLTEDTFSLPRITTINPNPNHYVYHIMSILLFTW